jgi:UDP-GlcNAc:undecaprenyl-phosphate GlcNAc-1-phosphate transferase
MYSLYFLGLISCLLSLLLTPTVRNLFRYFGIVDRSEETRRRHTAPIPRVGGIAVALSYALSFAILLASELKGGSIVWAALPFAWQLFPSAGLVFAVGLLDDLVGLRPWQKLIGQAAAAALAYEAGVRISGIHGHQPGMWWSLPLTVLWLVGCTNAVNLIDGVDGLATGVGLFASATSLLAALLQNNVALAYATVPLVGCLLGFLRFNSNPATIFLGDSGSLFVGFLLGCYGVLWSQKSATILGMTAPLLALAIPLLDTALAIARRFLRHQPIFAGDRGHIHHRLLDRGLTPRRVVLIIYGVCGICTIASLALSQPHLSGVVLISFCAAVWLGVGRLGYMEFRVAGRLFTEGAFRRLLDAQIALKTFEQELEAAATLEECWVALRGAYREFGFYSICVRLDGREWIDRADGDPPPGWDVRVPIGEHGSVDLRHSFGSERKHTIVVLFIRILRKSLESRLDQTAQYHVAHVGD